MLRFEDAPDEVITLMNRIISESFSELANAKIKVIFDLKKRLSNGKVVLGRFQKTSDLLRHLTVEEAADDFGFDYIMYLDKMIFTNITEGDKIKIIRHELRHSNVDMEADNPYKLRGHDLEDFTEEVELNSDDLRWAERCVTIGLSLYDRNNNQ